MNNNVNDENNGNSQRKFPLPEVNSIMPWHQNPLYPDGARPAIDWHYETCQLTRNQYRRVESCTLFIAYFYPFCTDKRRYDMLSRLMLNIFIIDDHLELNYGDMAYNLQRTADILSQMHSVCDQGYPCYKNDQGDRYWKHIPSYEWKPYIYALNALLDFIMSTYNDIQKSRFMATYKRWVDGMWEEAVAINQGQKFDQVEQFIAIRTKSIGMEMMQQLIEFAYDLYVPEQDWQNDKIKTLIHLGSILCIHVNDTYSFEKEFMDAGGQLSGVHDLTAITARMEGMGIEEALAKTAAGIHRVETEIANIRDELMADPSLAPDTRIFVDRACYLDGGHWKASTYIERYHKFITPEACDNA